MTDLACPNGADHELRRHPDALFCQRCLGRLPQRFRRAMVRVNQGPDRTPQGDKATLRAELFGRCQDWFATHPPKG